MNKKEVRYEIRANIMLLLHTAYSLKVHTGSRTKAPRIPNLGMSYC